MRKRFSILIISIVSMLFSTELANAEIASDIIGLRNINSNEDSTIRFVIQNLDATSVYSIPPTSETKNFISVLPPCMNRLDSECIESLSYRKLGTNQWESAVISNRLIPKMDGERAIQYANGVSQNFGEVAKNEFEGIPRGTTSSIWKLDNAPHIGGSDYLLSASITNNWGNQPEIEALNFSLNLRPIAWRDSPSNFNYVKLLNYITNYNFPQQVEYQIAIRLGFLEQKLSNWYNGRIDSPEISIKNNVLYLTGQPTWSPIADTKFYKCNDLNKQQLDLFALFWGAKFQMSKNCNDARSNTRILNVKDAQAFEVFQKIESDFIQYGKNSSWYLESVYSLGQCKEQGINGFVTSNALLYSAGPPKYSTGEKYLSYQIASTHLDEKGQVNRGRFNLTLKSSVASCLWGKKPSELNSSGIQITYGDGSPVIGTQSIVSKNGWTFINIENFSFSSPTFKIAPINVQPQITKKSQDIGSKSRLDAQRRISISCVKGKVIKEIIGINPKCPAGYKKK